MNKNKVVVTTAVIALFMLAWQLYQPKIQQPNSPTAEETTLHAGSEPSSLQRLNARIQASDPYARCYMNKQSDVAEAEKELEQLLVQLLSEGKTVTELLHYDVSEAISSYHYAGTLASAKNSIGMQAMNMQEPSILDMLAQRLQQGFSDDPVDFARSLAAQDEFQAYVSTGLGAWGGRMMVSPSIILMHLSPQIPFDDFRQMIAGKTFKPIEIAAAMQMRAPDEHLLQLIAQGEGLEQFPAGFQMAGGVTPLWNLADFAAALWQPAALNALKQQGVTPTVIEGVATGLDYALFSNPERLLDTDKDPALKQQLKQAQQQTVDYLLAEGYWAHGWQTEAGHWRFGNQFMNASRYSPEQILPLLAAGNSGSVFRKVQLTPQPLPADSALAQWVKQHADARLGANAAYLQCQQQKQQQLEQQGLLSRGQIQQLIAKELDGIADSQTAVKILHQYDPALLDWYWQRGGAREQELDIQIKQQLSSLLRQPAELQSYLQKNSLDSAATTWLLMEMLRYPELLPLFAQRYMPVAPDYLYPIFWYRNEDKSQEFLKAGYDFSLQDRHGRNLYKAAFAHSPQAVLLMLAQGVDPFSQQLGPDALDLALEFSGRQSELHQALPLILKQVVDFEPSHLARLKRLQLYQPELYQAIVKLKPKLILPADTEPNTVLTPLSF